MNCCWLAGSSATRSIRCGGWKICAANQAVGIPLVHRRAEQVDDLGGLVDRELEGGRRNVVVDSGSKSNDVALPFFLRSYSQLVRAVVELEALFGVVAELLLLVLGRERDLIQPPVTSGASGPEFCELAVCCH
jgi:hypothetical protein